MAKSFPYHVGVNGQNVGYSVTKRSERWEVYTRLDGRRVRLLSPVEARGRTPGAELHQWAERELRAILCPADVAKSYTWTEALAEVVATAPHSRPETLRSFKAAVKALTQIIPSVTGPDKVTDGVPERFARLWLAAPKADGGRRKPGSLSYLVRAMSAFYGHLRPLGIVKTNPWKSLPTPRGEKGVKPVPTDDQYTHFRQWVADRYPGWVTLNLWLDVKATTGCRTADVCQLPTAALADGRLTFPPATVKTKTARTVLLAPDLFNELKTNAGRTWLWERLFDVIGLHRKLVNGLPDDFNWKTVVYLVNNVFREYSDAHPDRPRLTPHALRRRAITLVTLAVGGNVDVAAQALAVNPTTARSHYLDASRAVQSDDVMRRAADLLRGSKIVLNSAI